MRERHIEPDEEHSTNYAASVFFEAQFFQDFTDAVTITTTGRGVKFVTNPTSGEVVTGNRGQVNQARRHEQQIRYPNFLNVNERAAW